MKLAIMQPYFFPYIGYFQLINAVDKFIFYDDVNFINRGWINRNRILINSSPHFLTVQLKGASQNKLIDEVEILENRESLKKTILMSYKKAPYFQDVWPIILDCMDLKTTKISELAIYSTLQICKYLEIQTAFEISSIHYPKSKGLKKQKRLIEICRLNKATQYINPIGGKEIYTKEEFSSEGIKLNFIQTHPIEYKQFKRPFVPWLSIIDIIMFNNLNEIKKYLDKYDLE